MKDDVIKRLAALGYEATTEDDWMLDFIIQKVEDHIKNDCNVTAVPDGLHQVVVERSSGEFLFVKKQSGRLEGFDLESAVKQVQAGDTSVTFADGASPESRLDALLKYLMSCGGGELACYRKIRW